MNFFARSALAVALAFTALTAGGCADQMEKLRQVYNVVTSASASQKAILVEIQTFDAIKISATGWLRLRRCDGTNGPICRDPALLEPVNDAIDKGTAARNDLKAWLRANPTSAFGPQELYDNLVKATAFIRKSIDVYNVAKG